MRRMVSIMGASSGLLHTSQVLGGIPPGIPPVDGTLAGILAVSDPVKSTTPEALAKLRDEDIRVVMATGDGVATARSVAQKLGIDEFYGELKPADKLAPVSKLQAEGKVVAMAGDGINDAPALAKAHVGLAM